MFKKWKEKKKADLYRRGYDWAAGLLLREECCIESIQAQISISDYDSFDKGVEQAISDFIKMRGESWEN